MDNRDELLKKIAEYKEEIEWLEEDVRNAGANDIFGRIAIVETNSKIRDYRERIERIARRINGTESEGPTEEQLKLLEWATSDEYDEL